METVVLVCVVLGWWCVAMDTGVCGTRLVVCCLGDCCVGVCGTRLVVCCHGDWCVWY